MKENDNITLEFSEEALQEQTKAKMPDNDADDSSRSLKERLKTTSTFEQIKQKVSEDDDAPVSTLTLRTILGGDILSTQLVRRQVWLLLLIMLFITISVAFRYQCQQDQIQISKMEQQLVDIKYKALSSASTLTERTRKSRVLEALRENNDSILHISTVPPYVIHVEN